MNDTLMHCNTLQHTRTYCNSPQHTATHCNTLQQGEKDAAHTAPVELPPKWEQCMDEGHLSYGNTLQHTRTHRKSLQVTAIHCNTLQQGEREVAHTASIALPPNWEQRMDE